MKNYKAISALIIGLGVGLTATASAEVTEECILTGKVRQAASQADTVRLAFTRIEHGEQARCRAKGRRGGLARMQFEPQSANTLAQLEDGAIVRYRYQNRNGQHSWQRLDVTARQVAQNTRDW
jgi:hypothetical protein